MTVDEPEPAKPIEFTVHPVAEGDVVVTEENCPPRVEDWERQNRAVAAASYYARRSARDPEWREAQLAEAKERERRPASRIRRRSSPPAGRSLVAIGSVVGRIPSGGRSRRKRSANDERASPRRSGRGRVAPPWSGSVAGARSRPVG